MRQLRFLKLNEPALDARAHWMDRRRRYYATARYTWPDTDLRILRILDAGVSVHLLTYDGNDGKVGIGNRACEFNHEQRTNEFTVCVYTWVMCMCVCDTCEK